MPKFSDIVFCGSVISGAIGGLVGISQKAYSPSFGGKVFDRTFNGILYSDGGAVIFLTSPLWITPMAYELVRKKFKW